MRHHLMTPLATNPTAEMEETSLTFAILMSRNLIVYYKRDTFLL